jgi:hypothetical protein
VVSKNWFSKLRYLVKVLNSGLLIESLRIKNKYIREQLTIEKNCNEEYLYVSRTSLQCYQLKLLKPNCTMLSTVIMDSRLRLLELESKCTGIEGMC